MISKEELEQTTPLEEHLAVVIADVIKDKVERKIAPAVADMQEIMAKVNKDVRDALNNMVRSGLLTFHRTLNSTTFEFTPPK